jgi:chromosome segregation ATPase
VLDGLQAEYDAYDANTGYSSTYYADLHVQLIAAWQVQWELDQQKAALDNEVELVDDLIAAYTADDLETLAGKLADLQDDLADATLAIEVAEQALASAQANADADVAYIAYLEAKIATLTARYENAMAIAAKYKALMDAALAS